MGLLCVTIDLDEIRCYHRIHGLPDPEGVAARAVHERALPRLARLVEETKTRATLFAVGEDLIASVSAAEMLRDLAGRGHEIGNHTLGHPYDLTTLDPEAQAREIDGGAEAIVQAVGVRPVGFRAPGYNVTSELFDRLADRGYLYDSSVFPCPAYWAARAAAMGLVALRGRRPASLVGDPRILTAPTRPYRVGKEGPWSMGDGLRELPITVVTPARLPLVGTALSLGGRLATRALVRQAASLPFVNLELHGIDLLDAAGDGLGDLARVQVDLGVSLARKREILESAISVLTDAGLEPVTLSEAAERLFA